MSFTTSWDTGNARKAFACVDIAIFWNVNSNSPGIVNTTYLDSALSWVHIFFIPTHGLTNLIHNLRRCPCKRIPAGGHDSDELYVIRRETSYEFHGQNLAENGPRLHDASIRQVTLRFR